MKSTSADITRALLKCRQEWALALGDPIDIPGVIAVTAADLSNVFEAHCAFVAGDVSSELIAAVDAGFAQAQDRCLRWISPANSALLEARSTLARRKNVLRLARWQAFESNPALMLLQARAAMAQTHRLFENLFNSNEARVRAAERHLDDAKFELLIGIDHGTPIGCAGLLVSGESAMIQLHHILPAYHSLDFERMLLDRVIELAARASLRHVLIDIDADDERLNCFYASVGFELAGSFFEYDSA